MKKSTIRACLFLITFVLLINLSKIEIADADYEIENLIDVKFAEATQETDEKNGYDKYVEEISKKYCIDKKIVYAIIEVESGGNPEAVSCGGDYGLMQINKCNFDWLKELGYIDMLDPETNIDAGCYIMSNYLKKYSLNLALMCYNSGEEGAKALWKKGIYETEYTKKVEKCIEQLR